MRYCDGSGDRRPVPEMRPCASKPSSPRNLPAPETADGGAGGEKQNSDRKAGWQRWYSQTGKNRQQGSYGRAHLPGLKPDGAENSRQAITRQNQWNDKREKMQTQMETMGSQDESQENESLQDMLRAENRERYDYRQFLRRFSVLKEEIEVDPDSFDPVFYSYGMSLYGNMPLIEPLETKEVFRIEDFVIVIDTSMSCSGELVQRFLEETYDVLSESETYFRKIRIHILQCDDKVQSDVLIECAEDLKAYMEHFQITGFGGTDFRPAFEYVNELRAKREVDRLRGLIYFTDGKGIYPVQAPVYDAAFVFIEHLYSDESVPAWAMKVVLEEEQLMEISGGDSKRKKDRE